MEGEAGRKVGRGYTVQWEGFGSKSIGVISMFCSKELSKTEGSPAHSMRPRIKREVPYDHIGFIPRMQGYVNIRKPFNYYISA